MSECKTRRFAIHVRGVERVHMQARCLHVDSQGVVMINAEDGEIVGVVTPRGDLIYDSNLIIEIEEAC